MPQTSYNMYQGNAFVGMGVDTTESVTESGAAESPILFGVAVKRGTSDNGLLPMGAAGDAALAIGISLSTQKEQLLDGLGTVFYANTQTVPYRTLGRVWVQTIGSVKIDSPVKVNELTGAFDPAGVLLEGPGGRTFTYKSSTTGPGLAIVEVR